MATKHISDLSKSPEQVLLDLINAANNSNLPLTAVTIQKDQDLASGRATAIVGSNRGSGYRGDVTVGYKQIDFDETLPLYMGEGHTFPAAGVPATIEGILNRALNINLRAGDMIVYTGAQQPNFEQGNVNFIQITASDESLIWDGQIEIEITALTVDGVPSYRVRFAPTTVGMGVMPATTAYDETGSVMLSEDGKIIVGG